MFETSRRLARDNGTMWTIHLVQGPAGHCVGLSPEDIRILRDADVKGCPQVVSNCSLAMGMAPVLGPVHSKCWESGYPHRTINVWN